MWSIPDLRHLAGIGLLVCAAAASTGCGFRPLYGKGSGSDVAALSTVYVETIPDRIGQKLRNHLQERLSPKGPARRTYFILKVTLTESRRNLAIRKDETATRANLVITANFELIDNRRAQNGKFTGIATSINSYNVLQSDFATLSAQRDARDRALRTIADEIRLRVAAAIRDPGAFTPVRKPAQP